MKMMEAILKFTETPQDLFSGADTAPTGRPFLKWAGGKTKLLPAILPHVPARIANYHEPFLGSGAVFFAVAPRISGTPYLGDMNGELVNAWQTVRDDPDGFLAAARAFMGQDTAEAYYRIRSEKPGSDLMRAARFIYLNQTAWNGLWRVNKHGVFNVPWGARPFRGLDAGVIQSASQVLQPAMIRHLDFREAIGRARPGDFVYLDPPYLPASDTSKFCFYTKERFRSPDLDEMASLCRKMSAEGINWMMSNRDNERMRSLFDHARIIPFRTWRSVSAQNRRNIQPTSSPEVIVVGGPACR
ncbi:Dam family site-specific DNA-(adenine-N6)-methyltransferase [Acidiphilium acidophilum]|uniref:DNA adenine methylase n=1 Tax=Acidiphilium acidophilum TaxID=76588 RepID=UPI002E8E6EDD|nr:Dam family site-specific DNA-(adenine-N6)-methyltransferase [Acidiphilium acidophilum]